MYWLICGVIGDIANGVRERNTLSQCQLMYNYDDYDSQLGGANRGRVFKATEPGLYLAFKTYGLF